MCPKDGHIGNSEVSVFVNDTTVYVKDMPSLEEESTETNETVNVILPFKKDKEYYVETLKNVPKKPVYSFFKRFFDIVFSMIALLVCAVPMAVIAIIIKKCSPGPVFFKQERLGLNGKKFEIVKFRTMCVDAEAKGAQWSQGDDDPRIFGFGRFLRKSRLDELPQFGAILCGKMSLVGDSICERLKVKPGLTGLAQVNGGYDLKPEEKIVWDVEYIKKRSLWLDAKILFKTIKVVLFRAGAK